MTEDQPKRYSSSYLDLEGHRDSAAIPAPTIGMTSAPQTIKSPLLRECLAEFLGTFILLSFSDGVVAQFVLSEGANGSYTHVNLCWGIAVMLGIHFSGGVSGAHLNPALALFGRFPWYKAPFYILLQLLGAFCGAAMVFIVYYPLFNRVDPERETAQGVFATYLSDHVPNATAFVTDVFGTALLLSGIFAIGGQLNKTASPYTSPSAVALLVVGIGMAFGMNSGYAINPARDLGPRLFSLCAGWGSTCVHAAGLLLLDPHRGLFPRWHYRWRCQRGNDRASPPEGDIKHTSGGV